MNEGFYLPGVSNDDFLFKFLANASKVLQPCLKRYVVLAEDPTGLGPLRLKRMQ